MEVRNVDGRVLIVSQLHAPVSIALLGLKGFKHHGLDSTTNTLLIVMMVNVIPEAFHNYILFYSQGGHMEQVIVRFSFQ